MVGYSVPRNKELVSDNPFCAGSSVTVLFHLSRGVTAQFQHIPMTIGCMLIGLLYSLVKDSEGLDDLL